MPMIFSSVKVESQKSLSQPKIANDYFAKGFTSTSITASDVVASHQLNDRWVVQLPSEVPIFGLEDACTKLVCFDSITISQRIDKALRERSVEATFDSGRAEAICKTSSFLEFRVCLFRGPDENSTYVEITRMEGCCFAFKQERTAILNAANDLGAGAKVHNTPKPLTIPKDLCNLYVPPTLKELEETIMKACDMFHSSDVHNVLFALSNLESISKCNTKMSKLIIQNSSQVCDIIVSLYVGHSQNRRDKNALKICRSSLNILVNGFKSISNERDFLDKHAGDFVSILVEQLKEDVKNHSCAHSACLALDCLCQLLNLSAQAQSIIVQRTDFCNIIVQAQNYGHREHVKLEQMASNALKILEVN